MHFFHCFLLTHDQHTPVSVAQFSWRIAVLFLQLFSEPLYLVLSLSSWFLTSSINLHYYAHNRVNWWLVVISTHHKPLWCAGNLWRRKRRCSRREPVRRPRANRHKRRLSSRRTPPASADQQTQRRPVGFSHHTCNNGQSNLAIGGIAANWRFQLPKSPLSVGKRGPCLIAI